MQLRKVIGQINEEEKITYHTVSQFKKEPIVRTLSNLDEDNSEINEGDREDNVSLDSDSDISDRSLTKDGRDEEDEFNLNISFSGGYVPNTDLGRVDRGQGNP